MDLKTRVQIALETRKLALRSAYDALEREEREADREKRRIQPIRQAFHNDAIGFARAQISSAQASLAGVSKYPPLS